MAKCRHFSHKTIAPIYDFDGTLTLQPMPEYTVLPKLGVAPSAVWRTVKREVARTGGDEMLTSFSEQNCPVAESTRMKPGVPT
jgi:hypothetical protein